MRRGWLFILIAAVLAGSLPALAQVPTSEQLELLRTLSPEDRQALMEQLGIGGSGTGDAPTNNSRNNNQRREGSNSDAAARRFARQAEEIEAALMCHPKIRQAAVIGVPDTRWGQRAEAYVVVSGDDIDEKAIGAWCQGDGQISPMRFLKAVHVVERLPTGPTGKLYRPALLDAATDMK